MKAGGGGAAAFAAKRTKLVLNLIQDVADWCRVFPGYCAMYGHFGLKKHDGFSGVMGVIVGVIGSYKVWQKVAPPKSSKLS